jgi:hypothetical protein
LGPDIKRCYTERRYTECIYAACCNAECRYTECRYAFCCNAKCRYAECLFAACRGAIKMIVSNHATNLKGKTGKTNLRGRLSTVDLLIQVTCFVKNGGNILIGNGADLN